ncbi:hypothetical protein ACHAW6_002863 [Cyclotella cf. meneghiniana]
MLEGKCHPATGLWIVPTNSEHRNITPEKPTFSSHAAHNAYQTTSKAKLIQFLHQCAFSLPPSTWINAINNKHFSSWPGLTADAVRKYLPPSTATAKGRIKKTPAGVRSTSPKQPTIKLPAPPKMTISPKSKIKYVPAPLAEDLFPAHEVNDVSHIFCWAALANQINGTTYTDLTGRFPTMSLKNKQYVFIAYNYTANAIIVRAITDCEAPTIIAAFDNVLDNDASSAITKYLCSQHIKWQLSLQMNITSMLWNEPFRPSKIILLQGYAPLTLWDKLHPQAQDSLNMLCASCIDPSKSAYKVLEGHTISTATHGHHQAAEPSFMSLPTL